MLKSFTIKRGDTSAALLYILAPAGQPAVPLGGATVVFNMRARGGASVVSRRPAAIEGNPDDGTVRYDWQSGDTAAPGDFEAEFEVTYADGTVETFPNFGFIPVTVSEDLG